MLVHGLGGSSESPYMSTAATAASALGLASLRLNLRGADGEIGDFYHGGLTADLAASTEELRPHFERIYILGFSLGGHVALRFGTEVDEPAVAALAAVCSPLDLCAGADAIDRPMMAPYRAYVLRRLKANYSNIARFGEVPTPPGDLRAVRTLRHWDSLTVVPRFGFQNANDYYAQASVGQHLNRLRRPSLLVAAENDPMIPPRAIRPHLTRERAPDQIGGESRGKSPLRSLTVRWLRRGGHLAFPGRVDLHLSSATGGGNGTDYVTQILLWLQQA
jgi:predicted alpha/beta-fold hydrolase